MDAKCRKNDCTTPPIVSKTEDHFVAEKYFFESFLKKKWGIVGRSGGNVLSLYAKTIKVKYACVFLVI
jgi:hypothetical protein